MVACGIVLETRLSTLRLLLLLTRKDSGMLLAPGDPESFASYKNVYSFACLKVKSTIRATR